MLLEPPVMETPDAVAPIAITPLARDVPNEMLEAERINVEDAVERLTPPVAGPAELSRIMNEPFDSAIKLLVGLVRETTPELLPLLAMMFVVDAIAMLADVENNDNDPVAEMLTG